MAGDMPSVDDENEDEKTPSDSALNAAVAAAQDRSESHESPTTVSDGSTDRGQTVEAVGIEDGDEIREVGGGSTRSDGGDLEVDLGGESEVTDDDGCLILD